ncbi:hypothetical protein BCT56_23025 [Vibrio lentus]|uniref:Apea-like HEPN domain-containing protein n=2 Tax=Vibrio lentus TaxID=136468 RepID=A0AB36XTN3_9VIBR|nr:hypothetical protein BCU51_04565 [Vibrio lentus]PMK35674.1 hypothetical protein BCU02_14910 [Vibrio lentus]PMK50210.1 hypothetical protein BCT99_01990 [Vibrio lentus]PML29065.1 hypothetical protein BCT79_25305 [Vibrio lentus]PMM42927.1 hypothetical protein BCT56_23025 [Vibrio lentus]
MYSDLLYEDDLMHKTTRSATNISNGRDFDITTETWVKPNTSNFDVHASAKINGRDAISVVYNSKAADALAAYGLIHKDLKFCKTILLSAIQLAGENLNSSDSLFVREEVDPTSDLLKAITLSFIITYGKCYTKADGRKVSLEAKDIFRENSNLMQVHEFLMHERNNYVAHAGNTSLEAAKTLILLDADESRREVPKLITHSNHIYAFESFAYKKFLEAIVFTESKLIAMIQKRVKKLQDKELKGIEDSYLYNLARKNEALNL